MMRFNKYLPFAVIYFFFNSLGLPFGLTYMTLLAPFFYWWVLTERKTEILIPFIAILFPFIFIHINIVGVQSRDYLVSLINLTGVYIFCQAVYTFLIKCLDIDKIFRWLLVINFFFCIAGIILYFTTYYKLLWIEQSLTGGINEFKRLRLFTYEASYYATLCVPIFFYYFLQILLGTNRINAWLLFLMITLPFVLSFSLGVITCMIIAALVCFIVNFVSMITKRRVINLFLIGSLTLIPAAIIIYFFFPDYSFFKRIENILAWQDTSGRGRTSEAFFLARQILEEKSEWWGIGLGQVKIIGDEIIRDFYLYGPEFNTIAIPNAVAETLAIFGWVGVVLRIGLQLFLFFYTKVWTIYFRLMLFVFVFVYQFTGSFITNMAEYVIWIMAFTATPLFEKRTKVFV